MLRTADDGRREVRARVLVNAAGPWVENVIHRVLGTNAARRVRLVKGSHLVVRKFWDGKQAYLLQNDDRRVIFVNPYEGDLCLIGTTDVGYEGRAEDVTVSEPERDYLLRAVNRVMRVALTRADIVAEFSGIRPLYDDNAAASASAVTRDYTFDIDLGDGEAGARAPVLSIFGGKITIYRKLAEHALDRLGPHLPTMGGAWTGSAPLPGGDMPGADFAAFAETLARRHRWLATDLARHYARLYGTRADALLAGARALADLGRHFGGRLYEREAVFLRETEWARRAEDVLERRTKHYLHMTAEERDKFASWWALAA